jgi:hypothetical protein
MSFEGKISLIWWSVSRANYTFFWLGFEPSSPMAGVDIKALKAGEDDRVHAFVKDP